MLLLIPYQKKQLESLYIGLLKRQCPDTKVLCVKVSPYTKLCYTYLYILVKSLMITLRKKREKKCSVLVCCVLAIRTPQRHTESPIKHLRWSTLSKYVKDKSH